MELRIIVVENHHFVLDFWNFCLVDVYRTDGLPVDWGFANEQAGRGYAIADMVSAWQLAEHQNNPRWGVVTFTVARALTAQGF